jgi:branched-subunit amino acid transport protein AzlD
MYINAMLFMSWNSFVNMTSFMGFLWLPLIVLWNKIENDFVRKTAFIIPCFVTGMFVVGNIYEFRIFGELVPIFLGAFCHIAASVMKNASYPDSGK